MTTTARLRWAVVGTGTIANRMIQDLQRLGDADVTAVVSRSEKSGRAFAGTYGIPAVFTDPAAAAASGLVDIAYIATPHSEHVTGASAFIRAGCAVLCEKPVSRTAAETEELFELARRHGVFCMEAMWTRFNPVVRELRRYVEDGRIGELRLITAGIGFDVPWDPESRVWSAALGGGATLDLGVYVVSLAQMLLGSPQVVAAHGGIDEQEVDRDVSLLLGWKSGAQAALSCSLTAAMPRDAVIVGTEGQIVLAAPFQRTTALTMTLKSGETIEHRRGLQGNGFLPMLREVQASVMAGELGTAIMPPEHSIAVQAVLDEALRQLRSPAEIGLPYGTVHEGRWP